MINRLALLVIVASMVACKPPPIIPEADMVKILTKVFITDAAVVNPHFGRIYYNVDSIDYYSNIYEPMGYTQQQFDSTLSYYARNPAELNRVMDKVVASLSQLESELNVQIKPEKVQRRQQDLIE